MIDPTLALISYLGAQPSVSTLTQGIYDSEIPTGQDIRMPSKVILVRPAGGPPGPFTIELNDRRHTILCYGETPHLARALYWTVYAALKALTPGVWNGTYIHWCKEASGPVDMRDPVEQWPYTASSWLARASDLQAP